MKKFLDKVLLLVLCLVGKFSELFCLIELIFFIDNIYPANIYLYKVKNWNTRKEKARNMFYC